MAMQWRRVFIGFVILVVFAVLVAAWIDGGREPVREIVIPVALTEDGQ